MSLIGTGYVTVPVWHCDAVTQTDRAIGAATGHITSPVWHGAGAALTTSALGDAEGHVAVPVWHGVGSGQTQVATGTSEGHVAVPVRHGTGTGITRSATGESEGHSAVPLWHGIGAGYAPLATGLGEGHILLPTEHGTGAGYTCRANGDMAGHVTVPAWHGTGAAQTLIASGHGAGRWVRTDHGFASGRTQAATANALGRYDVNLLSDTVGIAGAQWQQADRMEVSTTPPWANRDTAEIVGSRASWRQADPLIGEMLPAWKSAFLLTSDSPFDWQQSDRIIGAGGDHWQQADRVTMAPIMSWQQSDLVTTDVSDSWVMTLPRLTPDWPLSWQQGRFVKQAIVIRWSQGRLVCADWRIRWAQGGLVWNAPRYGPLIPPAWVPPWGTNLYLECPLPGTILMLGKGHCPYWPAIVVPTRSTYFVENSASLIRLPDRTPLPCTKMSIITDVNSWCWALSATLMGPDAWGLIQPNPLPIEVEATINNFVAQFLLDWPNHTREFATTSLNTQGISRSGWLARPFTPATQGIATEDANLRQLAENALANTGWTLNWSSAMVDYLVPAHLYTWNGTPIDQLIALTKPIDACLYSDPVLSIITAYPRYPEAAWLWEGLTPDIAIPDAALINWTRKPDIKDVINGCYIAGTQAGVLAWVKRTGTAGDLQPAQPIVEPLLCDADGVAARARGISVLSQSGVGWSVTANTWLADDPGLLKPGMLIQIGDMIGRCRSTKITADWSQGLQVHQEITLEIREFS
jgi:hypothetical protein